MLLMQQLQQYEQEIANLRGQLEELRFETDQMKAAERERYLDLDSRINALAEASLKPSATPSGETKAGASQADETLPSQDPEADRLAYMAGRDKLLAGNFDAARDQFESYLNQFPSGQFRSFAHFWLGEAYSAQAKPDKEKALTHFQTVVDDYPESSKAPSALYKVAVLQAQANEVGKAKVTLNKIILQFPESTEAAQAKSELERLGG